jgi:hypothetical protein
MGEQPPYQQPYQQPYSQDYGYLPYAGSVPQQHSGAGVASFVIGVAMAMVELTMVIMAAVLVQRGISSQTPQMEIAGCGMILGLAACAICVVLGIVGLTQSNRKKLFAVLGLCINGMILLFVLGLVVLGLAMRH